MKQRHSTFAADDYKQIRVDILGCLTLITNLQTEFNTVLKNKIGRVIDFNFSTSVVSKKDAQSINDEKLVETIESFIKARQQITSYIISMNLIGEGSAIFPYDEFYHLFSVILPEIAVNIETVKGKLSNTSEPWRIEIIEHDPTPPKQYA